MTSSTETAPSTDTILDTAPDTTEDSDSDSALDALLTSETDDTFTKTYESSRLSELQASSDPPSRKFRTTHASRGIQSHTEKTALSTLADTPTALAIFHTPRFYKCVKMYELLEEVMRRQPDVGKVVGVDVEQDGGALWICSKLKIKILPVLIGYVGGREVGRLVGFEGLKGGEECGVKDLERVLVPWGVGVRVDEDGEGSEEDGEEDEGRGKKTGGSWIGGGRKERERWKDEDEDED